MLPKMHQQPKYAKQLMTPQLISGDSCIIMRHLGVGVPSASYTVIICLVPVSSLVTNKTNI